jgi:hypothetical protein
MIPFFARLSQGFLRDDVAFQHLLMVLACVLVLVLVARFLWRWPVMQPVWHALYYDGTAVRRWAAGGIGFLAMLFSQVFIEGVDAAFGWSKRQWAARIVTSLIGLVLTMVNPTKKAGPQGAPQP